MTISSIWDWLRGRKRSVLDYSTDELTREERILAREKKALMNKMARLAREKHEIIQRGFARKSPELRLALAQDFEQKEAEERLTARSLNIKGKELLTISRIKMVRETQGEARTSRVLSGLSERDMLELQRLITADDVSREMYEDKLNEVLSVSSQSAMPEQQLTESGRKLMEMWQQMDDGELDEPTPPELEKPESTASPAGKTRVANPPMTTVTTDDDR